MPIADIENFVRGYDRTTYAIFAQQGDEPTVAELEGFEQEGGFRFPEEFRTYALHPLGGLYLEVKEELWPRPKAGDVAPFWSFLYGMYVYSLSAEAPKWMQLRAAWEEMAANGSGHLVPFLKVMGDADPYCFSKDGRIVIWRHEEPDEPEVINLTFSEVVMTEIRALEERKKRKLGGK